MRPNVQRFKSRRAVIVLGINVLVWVGAGVFLAWAVRGTFSGWFAPQDQTSFEDAFESITELDESGTSEPTYLPSPAGQTNYGITQALYNVWRQRQGQPIQPVARIDMEEVRSIYQEFWTQGNCDGYAAPLDLVCLDTVVSFGLELSKEFLMDLPADPQEAALTVVERRKEFRYQRAGNYAYGRNGTQSGRQWDSPRRAPTPRSPTPRSPSQRDPLWQGVEQQLEEGLQHDRALAALVESYTPSQQSKFSWDLRRWLGWQESESSSSETGDRPNTRPDTHSEQDASSGNNVPLSSTQIYSQAKPYTVEVWIQTTGILAPASGIVLTSDGLILTNYHVVNASSFDFVRLANGQDYEGTIIDTDPDLDLALIQLDDAKGLPIANLAKDSSHIRVGDTVYAIGSPTGDHWKMTTAEVIAVQSECGLARLECIRTPEGFLKPGNSGGPLLDSYGQVVGVNRAIQQSTGEGVSITVEDIKRYVETATTD